MPIDRLRSRPQQRKPISAEAWRVICPCQKHSGTTSGLRRVVGKVQPLRNPYAALLFGVPIALGAVALPSNEVTIPARPVAPVLAAVRPVQLVQPLFGPRDLQLNLITPKVREEFLDHGLAPDHFSLELVTAEFFRTEVPYGSIIYREARRQGLSPEFVAAVVEAESDFRPRLLSNKNAHGLMQLIPSTGELMGVSDLMNPSENVRGGTRYLKYLHHRFKGDQTMILAAYNAGEGTVRRFGGVPPYSETQNYLARVARSQERYQKRVAKRMSEMNELVKSSPAE